MNKACLSVVIMAIMACDRQGSIENGRLIMGPGVFSDSGPGTGWDGVTEVPRTIYDEIVQSMEDNDTVRAREVYLQNPEAVPPPALTGYITYDGERDDLEYFHNWDETGFFLQFVTKPYNFIPVGMEDTLRLTLFDTRISTDEPIVDLDLGLNWRDCRDGEDTGDWSWFYFEETEYRLLWYNVFCVWNK